MSNPVRGFVSENLGGKRINLRLSANEWCELEDEFGKTTDTILKDFYADIGAGTLKMKVIRSLFRAALSASDPGITDEAAGEMMAEHGLVQSATLLGHVIAASMPQVEVAPQPGNGVAPGKPKRSRARL